MLLYWILLPIVWVLAHILFRFEVIGRENLKAVRDGRAYVIAPNHIANLDPVLIAITIFDWKRLRILAKEELFKNPLAGWFLRCMGAVSIERGKGDTTTVEKLTNECKNGTGIMIFPEGTRTKTGKLGVIKSGAFVIAAAAGADMLPVRIIYGTKDGRLVTPKSDTILPSITRRSLLQVAKDYLGMEVEERPVELAEIGEFAECGLCGTAAVISPVGTIVDHGKEIHYVGMGPTIQKLYDTLTGIQMGRLEAPKGWIRIIE